MRSHWSYLKYVIRHKWFVLLAGLQIGAPLWRLIIHDWTKFLPCEWGPYVEKFYGKKVDKDEPDDYRYWSARGPVDAAFDHAWNHHQKANKHHWQYWLLTNDSDDPKHKPMQMPEKFVLEMVADWMGAGRAITGKWEVFGWYQKNKEWIVLQGRTRTDVESLLGVIEAKRVQRETNLAQRLRILGY